MPSEAAVALNVGVRPMTRNPSYRKCSAHRSVRGLKIGTSESVSGSTAASLACLRSEQETQASARLSMTVGPFDATGMT